MPSAGDLRERLRFDRRGTDEYGDPGSTWVEATTLAAKVLTLLGSTRGAEPIMGERLQGRQPVVITVRNCAASRAIDTTYRAVDTRSGAVYGIKAVTPLPTHDFIDFLAEADGTRG